MENSIEEPIDSPWLVPFDGGFEADHATSRPAVESPSEQLTDELKSEVEAIYQLQRKLYADGRFALLLMFQALDAAGKDSTIRKVFSGVNPAGVRVHSFKAPSRRELAHDFLWRHARVAPQRGHIGVFNRSQYEEVLVVRVHPEYLAAQNVPGVDGHGKDPGTTFWQRRFESLRQHEQHLAANGTVIMKFWLNVSAQEQARRLLRRLRKPDKHWKFNPGDLAERDHREAYLQAYSEALSATSRPWAPWYAIPADDKPLMRATVAGLVRARLENLPLGYPDGLPQAQIDLYREQLETEMAAASGGP